MTTFISFTAPTHAQAALAGLLAPSLAVGVHRSKLASNSQGQGAARLNKKMNPSLENSTGGFIVVIT
ncbi:hypothetical protein HCZ54_05690 [Limosilactobacillus fermentum]